MKSILVAVMISTAAPQKESPTTLPKNKLNSQEGIVLMEHSEGITVLKKFHGWGGPMYRVRVKDEQGKVLKNFVSDEPFKKTASGWSFKVEGRNQIKEVSGNVVIERL
jgi:hypothetical protein